MADPWAMGLQGVEDSGTQAATGKIADSSQEPGPLLLAQKAPMRVVLQREGVLVGKRLSKVLELSSTPLSLRTQT